VVETVGAGVASGDADGAVLGGADGELATGVVGAAANGAGLDAGLLQPTTRQVVTAMTISRTDAPCFMSSSLPLFDEETHGDRARCGAANG